MPKPLDAALAARMRTISAPPGRTETRGCPSQAGVLRRLSAMPLQRPPAHWRSSTAAWAAMVAPDGSAVIASPSAMASPSAVRSATSHSTNTRRRRSCSAMTSRSRVAGALAASTSALARFNALITSASRCRVGDNRSEATTFKFGLKNFPRRGDRDNDPFRVAGVWRSDWRSMLPLRCPCQRGLLVI